MADGSYTLVLQIVDKSGKVTSAVMPIYIGKVASGDVDGDGKITTIDALIAFQIAGGNLPTATAAQKQAADMDGDGDVDMIDVAVLFNKVNK